MIYSKHFGYMARNNGQPNLSNEQFRRMMNIISIESMIEGMTIIKEKYKDTSQYYKYDTLIFNRSKLLIDLTGNLDPKDLIREMYNLSK